LTDHLVIYARTPIAGYTKTRLAKGIGAQAAAGVYARLLYSLSVEVERSIQQAPLHVTLSLSSEADISFFLAAFPEWRVTHQVDGDLGERMTASLQEEFSAGAEKVVLIGSDIPFLSSDLIQQAFVKLDDCEVLFGPTVDGGFYLIGTTIAELAIFKGVAWSTETVLLDCQQNAINQGFTVDILAKLFDMDTQKEYFLWKQRLLNMNKQKE
jgi:rSAM/selenodomain-associated transferase 1